MALKKGCKDLVAEAMGRVRTLTLDEAKRLHAAGEAVFVDLRDVRELEREGMVPGAEHAPRGMLEFWVDPDSPYFKEVFASGREFVFYCQSGWRSALATDTVQAMGLEPVCHIEGGFRAWKEDGAPVGERPARKKAE